jgi:hypothetical protein
MDGDLVYLRRSILPVTGKMLSDAFSNLFNEYCDISGNGAYRAEMEKRKDCYNYAVSITILENLIAMHRSGIDCMKEIRQITYRNTVQEAEGLLKFWKNELEALKGELEKQPEKQPEKRSKSGLDSTIASVCSYFYPINPKEISVSRFAVMVKEMTDRLKQDQLKNQANT